MGPWSLWHELCFYAFPNGGFSTFNDRYGLCAVPDLNLDVEGQFSFEWEMCDFEWLQISIQSVEYTSMFTMYM